MKISGRLFLLTFIWHFILPAFLHAQGEVGGDPYYGAAGVSQYRDPLSLLPFEHIDTFTGGVTLSFIDAKLPGNGGLDLVIQRSYNSKKVCKEWGANGACGTIGENS